MPQRAFGTSTTPLYVAGHRGLVGSAITREATARGLDVVGRSHAELELMDQAAVDAYVGEIQPGAIVMASALAGGILANTTYPASFIHENLQVQGNLLSAAVQHGVPRVLFLASSAIYPEHAPQPLAENILLSGTVEPAHEAYAIAKIAGIAQVRAIRRQHGLSYISVVPTNVYGPGAKFDLDGGHVVPSMIRRIHEAKLREDQYVVMWGSGAPRRELLHSDDLARACLFLLESYDEQEPVNVGTGTDTSVAELASLICRIVGYAGEVIWDRSKPDGVPRRQLDSRKINALGWTPIVDLEEGLRGTYAAYLESLAAAE